MTTGSELLQTPDAQRWGWAFMAQFGHRKEDIDEALMIGWFANAIEVGRAAGYTNKRPEPRKLCALDHHYKGIKCPTPHCSWN